jgi:hypothetical protein
MRYFDDTTDEVYFLIKNRLKTAPLLLPFGQKSPVRVTAAPPDDPFLRAVLERYLYPQFPEEQWAFEELEFWEYLLSSIHFACRKLDAEQGRIVLRKMHTLAMINTVHLCMVYDRAVVQPKERTQSVADRPWESLVLSLKRLREIYLAWDEKHQDN